MTATEPSRKIPTTGTEKKGTVKMNKLTKWLVAAGVALASVVGASPARADGLVLAPRDLAESERESLRAAIAQAKADDPEAFEIVRNLQGYKPERYRKFRKAVPMVGRELRHLGARALMPMIEALAFDVWEQGDATDVEWRALTRDMLMAVGEVRDARASSVLRKSFDAVSHPDLLRASARGMGMVCDDGAFGDLEASLRSDRRSFGVEGMGFCLRVEATQRLAAELDAATSPSEAEAIARALGSSASSWAWTSLGEGRAAEGRKVREIASAAALRAFVRFEDTSARGGATYALTMAALPDLRSVAASHTARASEATKRAVERVVQRVERRTKRRR